MNKIYIAYGSNLNLEQMRYRCPHATVLGTSELKDYRLIFRRSYLSIEKSEGDSVPVLLWEITPTDEKSLDRYEGYPRFYRKETVTVELDGKPVKAMVYIMDERFPLEGPSFSYYSTVTQGYKDCGFDPSIVREAAERDEGHTITPELQRQIFAIRDTGLTNMLDAAEVKRLAKGRGYTALIKLINSDPGAYARFILYGDPS